jgi:transglutaminase-like putative cysteine protease
VIYHPAWEQPVNYSLTEVSDVPDEQVASTVALMRGYVMADAKDPAVLNEARRVVEGAVSERDAINRIFHRVKSTVQFVQDIELARPTGIDTPQKPVIEVLIRPADMVVMTHKRGDCDCFTMYTAALLTAAGVRCSFCTVAANAQVPDNYSHIYAVAYTADGERIPVDTSHGPYAGWEAPDLYGKVKEWPLGAGLSTVAMLAGAGILFWYWARRGRAN